MDFEVVQLMVLIVFRWKSNVREENSTKRKQNTIVCNILKLIFLHELTARHRSIDMVLINQSKLVMVHQ